MRILKRILYAVVALAAVVFAVANRDAVTVNLWPLPFEATLPLYLVALGAAALGLLVGVTISWVGKERMWLRARGAEKRARTLERETGRETGREAGRSAPAESPATSALTPAQRTARLDDE